MRVPHRYVQLGASAKDYAISIGASQSPAGGRRTAETSADAVRYLAVVAATIVIVAAAFAGVLWGLEASRLRPPPAFSNSYCLDAKLEFLRQNPPIDPTHLIVGSSIGWRNIDANAIVEQHPDVRPLNGAFCGLSINQSAFATRFFLQRFPTITDVLLVVDPFDMSSCRSNRTAMFDAADVSGYLAGADDLSFYFKYFDLFSLFVNAIGAKEVFTRYGDGPLDTDESRSLVYGPAPNIQSECLAALTGLAEDVEKSGKRLIVVSMPLLGDWSEKYDRDLKARAQLANAIRRALNGKPAVFWDGWSEITVPPAHYLDAVHLRWSAVPNFTRQLVQATGFGSHKK
jgi:hypothetical protein